MNKKFVVMMAALGLMTVGGLMSPLSSCTKPLQWVESEWDATESEQPMQLPPSLNLPPSRWRLGAHQVEFQEQVIGGIPIAGSFVKKLSLGSGDDVVWSKAKFLISEDLPTAKWVAKELQRKSKAAKALITQQNAIGCKPVSDTKVELQWHNSWHLVYKQVCEKLNGEGLEIIVSSRGKLLSNEVIGASMSMEEQTATLYPKGPKLSDLTPVKINVAGIPNYLFNSGIEVTSDSGEHLSALDQIQSTAPGTDRFDMLQAYYFAAAALRWVESHMKFEMTGLKLRTQVGYPNKTNVAFYYNREIRIGTGDGVTYLNMAWDPSIVIHETMHGVVDALTRLPLGKGEGGSLQEALADSLTALQLDNPKMGETSFKEAPYQRTLANDLKLTDKLGKVYHDSLILSGTIWELKEAVGAATAEDLTTYLLAHLVPSSGFADTKMQIQAWLNSIVTKEKTSAIEAVLNSRGWL